MKKVFLILFVLAFSAPTFVACTPENIEVNEQQSDKDEEPDPDDRD